MTLIPLYGFASGIAANNPDCGLGPVYLYMHPELWQHHGVDVEWRDLIVAQAKGRGLEVEGELVDISLLLAENIAEAVAAKERFCVLSGDHSSGIGTWSGAAYALRETGPLGLIWIDAHMDAHTPETSPSQNIHGMPVAHLLGRGLPSLTQLLDASPKLLPQHLCLIGIRSFEPGEAALLRELNVKIYFMEEVQQRGIEAVFKEAVAYIEGQGVHFGLSIDIDAFDPSDAPGVGCREVGGISAQAFVDSLPGLLPHNPHFVGLEISEYNPIRDERAKTAQWIPQLLKGVFGA
jgi:arginase